VNIIRTKYSRARELRAQPVLKYASAVFRRRDGVWKPEDYNVQSHHTQNRCYQDESTQIAGQYDYFSTRLRPQRRVAGQAHLRLYRDAHGWRHHRSEESVCRPVQQAPLRQITGPGEVFYIPLSLRRRVARRLRVRFFHKVQGGWRHTRRA